MKRISIILVLLICSTIAKVSAQMPAGGGEKIVLPLFGLYDTSIKSAVDEVNDYILKKPNGFLWPVTKIIFSKEAENMYIDVIAIDNSWFKLFDPQEDLYGYFVSNTRIYVVTGKGEQDLKLNDFFVLADDTRTFYKPNLVIAPPSNPTWHYIYKDGAATLLKYENLEALGK